MGDSLEELGVKVQMSVDETQEEFIFNTVFPFCNAVTQKIIKKSDLEEALRLWSKAQSGESVTEFADRCKECGARYGKLLEQVPKIGHWTKHTTLNNSYYYDCSLCGCIAPHTDTADRTLWKLSKFCPDCGAKMLNHRKVRW